MKNLTFTPISDKKKEELQSFRKRNYKDYDDYNFLSRITTGDPIQIKNYSHEEFYKVHSKKEDVFKWNEKGFYIIPTNAGVFKVQGGIINLTN